MSATQHRRILPEGRDQRSLGAPLLYVPLPPARHGNDNVELARAIEELTQSKKQMWARFFRGLMLGGLLFALMLIALLVFVYSGHP